MVLTRTKVEVALIRPGVHDNNKIDASLENGDRIKILKPVAADKIKGNTANYCDILINILYYRHQTVALEDADHWRINQGTTKWVSD